MVAAASLRWQSSETNNKDSYYYNWLRSQTASIYASVCVHFLQRIDCKRDRVDENELVGAKWKEKARSPFIRHTHVHIELGCESESSEREEHKFAVTYIIACENDLKEEEKVDEPCSCKSTPSWSSSARVASKVSDRTSRAHLWLRYTNKQTEIVVDYVRTRASVRP